MEFVSDQHIKYYVFWERYKLTLPEHIIYSMYYVYLIRTERPRKIYYTGYTNNLRRRLKEHKERKPKLIYYEAYISEKDARVREKKLKQRGQTIRRLKERLNYSLQEFCLEERLRSLPVF